MTDNQQFVTGRLNRKTNKHTKNSGIIQNSMFTVVQGSLQNGGRAAPAVTDPSEGQDLDLVQDVLAQSRQLDAVAGVPFHRPGAGSRVRVLLLVHHLRHSGHARLRSDCFEPGWGRGSSVLTIRPCIPG